LLTRSDSLKIDGSGSRTNQAAWTLAPVTDPRKLELMRCAYQRVISQCGLGYESVACPDCRKRFNKFYTGRAYERGLDRYKIYPQDPNDCKKVIQVPVTDSNGEFVYYTDENGNVQQLMEDLVVQRASRCYKCDDDCRVANVVPGNPDDCFVCSRCRCPDPCIEDPCCPPSGVTRLPGINGCESGPGNPTPASEVEKRKCNDAYCNSCDRPNSGQVNSECLYSSNGCWFCWGCKKCVPKHCSYVGRYCDSYVWVPEGPGRDELAKLTLAILDYAVNDAPTVPRKTVYALLDKDGAPTTYPHASMVVSTEVSVDELSRSTIRADIADAQRRQSETRLSDALIARRRDAALRLAEKRGLLAQKREQLAAIEAEINASEDLDSTTKENALLLMKALRELPPDQIATLDDLLEMIPKSNRDGVTQLLLQPPVDENNATMKFLLELFEVLSGIEHLNNEIRGLEQQSETVEESLKRLPPPVEPVAPAPAPSVGPLPDVLQLQQQLETVR